MELEGQYLRGNPKKVHICAYCGPDITHIIDSETPANDRYTQKTEKVEGYEVCLDG